MRRAAFAALLLLAPAVIWSQSTVPKHLQRDFGNDKGDESAPPSSIDTPVVRINVVPESPSPSARETIVVAVVTATQDAGPVTIEVIAGGGVRAARPAGFASAPAGTSYFRSMANRNRYIQRLPALNAGQSLRIRIPVTLSAVDGFVAVTVASPDGESFSENDTLFLGRGEGQTISSGSSLQDLRRQRLILRSRRQGSELVAPGTTLEEALIELEQEGRVDMGGSSRPPIGPSVAPQAQISVTGRIQFTASDGDRHPVRGIRVEIRDEDTATADDILATVQTNDQGEFSATVANTDEDGTGADLHAIAYAIGATVEVSRYAAINGVRPTRSIKSELRNNVGSGPIDLSIVASNDEANFPNAVAFEIYEAANYQSRYVRTLEGGTAPELVIIRYPRLDEDGQDTSDSSWYGNGRIRLGLTDAHDWDNIMHEYGHHLQAKYQFGNNPGGSHTGTQNHCQAQSSRDEGLRLAWSESWPTFFALQTQASLGLAGLGIPDLGDTLYQDRKPGTDLVYNLEVPNILTSKPPSEGQEHALQRVTWDMFDTVNDISDANVAYPPARLWAAAKASGTGRFASFWQAFSQPLSDGNRGPLGDILALHWIGPTTNPVSSPTGGGIPTLTWRVLLGCSGGSQIRYRLRFWDPQTGANVLETPFQTGTQFTPSAAQIATLFPQGRTRVGWTVVSRDQASPQTGDYPG
ncbi:MAG TPA: hypothetical protein VGB57_00215, partial [Allosphingosinicella sp.]